MSTPLLAVTLQSERDVLEARQRGRQLAGLLGYDAREQVLVAAAVFEVAWSAWQNRGRCRLCFHVEAGRLTVIPGRLPRQEKPRPAKKSPESSERNLDERGLRRLLEHLSAPPAATPAELRLEKPLPAAPGPISAEDLPWALRQLSRHTPHSLFDEIHRQNQELLKLLHELKAREAEPGKRKPDKPSAA